MATWTTEKELEGNIKMDLRKIGCEDVRWMKLAQDCVQWRDLVCAV
jgi:hypothetical protein